MVPQIIQDEFEGYIRAVYPGLAPGSDQYEHLRGSFFGGALIALNHSVDGDLDDVKSMRRELREFGDEAPIATRVLGERVS